MSPQILDVRSRAVGSAQCLLAATGEIDHDTATVLADAIETAIGDGRDRIVLDLERVTFCDSGGLSIFVDTHRRCASRGGWFRLAGARAQVVDVLTATNLDSYLALRDSAAEALDG